MDNRKERKKETESGWGRNALTVGRKRSSNPKRRGEKGKKRKGLKQKKTFEKVRPAKEGSHLLFWGKMKRRKKSDKTHY